MLPRLFREAREIQDLLAVFATAFFVLLVPRLQGTGQVVGVVDLEHCLVELAECIDNCFIRELPQLSFVGRTRFPRGYHAVLEMDGIAAVVLFGIAAVEDTIPAAISVVVVTGDAAGIEDGLRTPDFVGVGRTQMNDPLESLVALMGSVFDLDMVLLDLSLVDVPGDELVGLGAAAAAENQAEEDGGGDGKERAIHGESSKKR